MMMIEEATRSNLQQQATAFARVLCIVRKAHPLRSDYWCRVATLKILCESFDV